MHRVSASTVVLESEPRQAHALEWMPLAVRYKLDVLGLSMRLAKWQDLALDVRRALVQLPARTEADLSVCRTAFTAAGAHPDPGRRREWRSFEAYLDARAEARAAPVTRNI